MSHYVFLLCTFFLSCECHLIFISNAVVNGSVNNEMNLRPVKYRSMPVYWDWRDNGSVSPVKNQLNCEACWAFSAIANIESHLKIYLNQEEVLSEQFLIDCDGSNVGCGSTSVLKAFGRIVSVLGGVLRDSDYIPYASRQMQCKWNKQRKPIPVIGFRRVKSDEDIMAQHVFKYGPLSAAINSASMAVYKGGIDEPTDEKCPPNQLNHAILIVGYNVYVDKDTGKEVPYWIIKNSWGEEWGDKGFYYLVRGRNACGIASDVSFSLVK